MGNPQNVDPLLTPFNKTLITPRIIYSTSEYEIKKCMNVHIICKTVNDLKMMTLKNSKSFSKINFFSKNVVL